MLLVSDKLPPSFGKMHKVEDTSTSISKVEGVKTIMNGLNKCKRKTMGLNWFELQLV